ncbi:hypothetical protein DY000_02008959 [Brassica cretica]|uniref:Uncharacterized protein n=1 Tax=Brassica cretica TaxID=69181 RepID=A0ABQ7CA67_BRACR|nr:hypothetical protein DY000_02008959 [Brassica cretica]
MRKGSWSRRQHMKEAKSSTEADRRGENGDVLVQSMHISWGRRAWCGAYLVGKKHILCGIFHVRNVVETWLLNQKIVVLDRHKKLKGGDWRCKMSAMK